MADSKKKKTNKADRINIWLYHTLIPTLIFLSRIIFGVKVDKSKIKDLEGPFLVLGNHTSPIDFLFFSGCVYPKKLNYVVASNMYYTKVYGWYLRRYRTISKKQFSADFSCIKQIKRNLDNGTSVLLFPEGRVTVDGTTGFINPTIGKLVKWLGYPVVSGLTRGAYVGNPKWGKKRDTKISLAMEQILSKEDIQKMSAEEISEYVVFKLQYNDNQTLIDNNLKIKGDNLAEGLEKILYKCPNCGREFTQESKLKTMTCSACGNSVLYDNDGILKPATPNSKCFTLINQWYKYERDCLSAEIENESFELSDKVVFSLNNDKLKKFTEVGEGVLTVNRSGIYYKGTGLDGNTELEFKIQNHGSLAFKMGEDLEVSEEDNIYRFRFVDGLYSTKYVLAIEEIYKKYYLNKA